MLAFGASRRACRPTAVCIRQQTGKHTKPASREARRRAAVTPQPTCFPSSGPAPIGRGMGCRGGTSCREPEGLLLDGGLHTPTNRKLHQTGEPRGPSPSGGKPRPTSFPSGALRAYGAQSEWGSAPSPVCGEGGRRRRPGESEGEGQREGRHPWSGCRPSERAGRRWRP